MGGGGGPYRHRRGVEVERNCEKQVAFFGYFGSQPFFFRLVKEKKE